METFRYILVHNIKELVLLFKYVIVNKTKDISFCWGINCA
jgi:hypothetical protein